MRIAFNPLITSDLDDIRDYYLDTETEVIADEFYQEFRASILKAAERPFSFEAGTDGIRRYNLRRFPYHFLFRVTDDTIRILVIRHNRRSPSFGRRRR
jgi:plasmid stabilization system protein ParE